MIETLFAVTLLCTAPATDGGSACEHPEHNEQHEQHEQYDAEWIGRGLPSAPSRSDTTIQIERGTTLVLRGMNGDIRVATWAKPMLRVQTEHGRDDRISLLRRGRRLHLSALRPHGVADEVEWNLTVPAWMPLQLSCMGGDVDVTGTQGALEVSALSGDVHVEDARGPMQLNSVEGEVYVIDTQGHVTASSINNDVHLMRIIGEIDAQSINGSIRLEQLDALQVAASSVNGRVWFLGPFLPRGQYNFTSHNGELVLGLPEGQGAQIRVNTYQGDVHSDLTDLRVPEQGHPRSFSFTMGEGGSEVDLESFSGLIQLLKLGDVQERLRRLDSRMQARELRRTSPRVPRAPRSVAPVVPAVPKTAPAPVPPPEDKDREEDR